MRVPSYPLVFFDTMRVKIRDEGLVRNKAIYLEPSRKSRTNAINL